MYLLYFLKFFEIILLNKVDLVVKKTFLIQKVQTIFEYFNENFLVDKHLLNLIFFLKLLVLELISFTSKKS